MNLDRVIEEAASYLGFTASCISLERAGTGENLAQLAYDLASLVNKTPITEKWVFTVFPSKGEQYSARERVDCPGLVWLNRFEYFELFKSPVPQLKTQGQVRQLAWVLFGVNL